MKLKRKKKITKRELKRDPFVEFVEKTYERVREKPREYIGGVLLVIAAIFLVYVLRSGSNQDFPVARQMWFQAVSLMQAQRLNDATQVLQDLSVRFPKSPEGKKAIYYLANFAFFQGDYVTAKTRYETYLSRKPEDPLLKAAAKEALGVIDFIMGNYESGRKRIMEAYKEIPYKSFKTYFAYHLIKLLIQKELYKEAYDFLKKVKDDVTPQFRVDFVKLESFLEGVLEL